MALYKLHYLLTYLLTLWMDDGCLKLRRTSRILEQRYRQSDLADDRQAWVEHERGATWCIERRNGAIGRLEYVTRRSCRDSCGAHFKR